MESESTEHVWVGDGYPLGANKLTADACRRRLQRSARETDATVVSIDVVCNDSSMADRELVEEVYRHRASPEYDLAVHEELSTAELARVFESSTDFVHYVGHVDDAGIQCSDGAFDVRSLDSAGADAFLLNACGSFEQGEALLDAGCIAGVATLGAVPDVDVIGVSRHLVRLLNTGLSLRAALTTLQERVDVGHGYTVLGDGSLQLLHCEAGCPVTVVLSPTPDVNRYEVRYRYYPSSPYSVGSLVSLSLDTFDGYYLGLGSVGPREITTDELEALTEFEWLPVEVDGELLWDDELLDVLGLDDPTGD